MVQDIWLHNSNQLKLTMVFFHGFLEENHFLQCKMLSEHVDLSLFYHNLPLKFYILLILSNPSVKHFKFIKLVKLNIIKGHSLNTNIS
jgi:hypothetical protein